MHISLGVRRDDFPIDKFLRSGKRKSMTVSTAPWRGHHAGGSLTLVTNPTRRSGEWIIRDQFSHRHPAWSAAAGFPRTYRPKNPPYILIFRVGNVYHVRFSTARQIASFAPGVMLSDQKGIVPTTPALLRHFSVRGKSTVQVFREEIIHAPSPSFDPKNIEDGRRRVLRQIYARQGQRTFRRKLIKAYASRCAITGERAEWVLEAAHITPYMGVKTNTTANGLLLRADIHTLFDLALIAIDPDKRRVRVSSKLARTPYAKFAGKPFAVPKSVAARPSIAALREHFSGFEP